MGHMIFGGHDFGELFYCHAEKPLLPPLKIRELDVEGMDGTRYAMRNAEPVEVKATLITRDPKQSDERLRNLLDEVSGHLAVEQAELYLPGYEDRCYIASVSGTSSVEEFVTSARLKVTFRAASPYMLGRKRSAEVTAGSNTIKRGGNAPASFTFDGNPVSSATYIRIRKGTVTANPRVIIYKNKRDEGTAWSTSDAIHVDMGKRLVTANGSRWPMNLNSEFWLLDSDSVNVHMTGAEGTVEWRETWL